MLVSLKKSLSIEKFIYNLPVRRDLWAIYNYKNFYFFSKKLFKKRYLWKSRLNRKSYNPRRNFFGQRLKNLNFVGKRWRWNCFYHVVRRYRLRLKYKRGLKFKFRKKKKERRSKFFIRTRRYQYYALHNIPISKLRKNKLKFQIRLFFRQISIFFKFCIALKTVNFLFNAFRNLNKGFKKNVKFLSRLKAKESDPQIELRLNSTAWITNHAKHVQINSNLQSGIYLGYVNFRHFRFPNIFFRGKLFSKLYFQYLFCV